MLEFNGIGLKRGKYFPENPDKKHLYLSTKLKDKETGQVFEWIPTYKTIKCLIHYLMALHGEEVVMERLLSKLMINGKGETWREQPDRSFINIYNRWIENEIHNSKN